MLGFDVSCVKGVVDSFLIIHCWTHSLYLHRLSGETECVKRFLGRIENSS